MYASSKKSCSYLKLSIEGNDIYFLNKIASFIMQKREEKQFETGLEK